MDSLPGYDDWLTRLPESGPDPEDYPNERPQCVNCGEERVRVSVFAGGPASYCEDCQTYSSDAVSTHFRWLPLFTGEWETEGRDEG